MHRIPWEFAITLLVMEFIASLYEPAFFKIFAINLGLIIIQLAIKNKNK